MEEKMKVSVVIPTRNEEPTIAEIIEGCRPYADELLVIDGHSTDKTREIAKEHGARVEFDHGKGKGEALRTALKIAKGDIVVFIDADGSHDPNDIPKLVQPIHEGKADMVVGSRGKGGSDELHGDFAKFVRMIGSDLICLAINYRFNVRLTDSQNGFRAIRRDVGNALGLKENITTIEQEMAIKCLKKGYKIAEAPTHEYERKYGESIINVWHVWPRYIWSVIKNIF
jgi:dolichol-phosphate mannosyltransferase